MKFTADFLKRFMEFFFVLHHLNNCVQARLSLFYMLNDYLLT